MRIFLLLENVCVCVCLSECVVFVSVDECGCVLACIQACVLSIHMYIYVVAMDILYLY